MKYKRFFCPTYLNFIAISNYLLTTPYPYLLNRLQEFISFSPSNTHITLFHFLPPTHTSLYFISSLQHTHHSISFSPSNTHITLFHFLPPTHTSLYFISSLQHTHHSISFSPCNTHITLLMFYSNLIN